ncbi:hypothetical protein [Arthrobacter sp.]|uniref:hypothetical protein n=1 Tax=Arthrobacter sp. TaxID=1667 RepID=UPI003A8D927C
MGSPRAHRHPTRHSTLRRTRRATRALALLVVPLALAACTGTQGPGPSQPGSSTPSASTGAPASSTGGGPAASTSASAPPLTGPLPTFTAEELTAAAQEIADGHPGSRVRGDEEIQGLAASGQQLLDGMDITPAKCAPFMDDQNATVPTGATIASVTIPGGSVENETYISLASYPGPRDAADAVSRTTALLRSCGTFTLQLGGTEGTATLKSRHAASDAESTAGYWMQVQAGGQNVASYTMSGNDGAVVVSVTTRDDTEAEIMPDDVRATLDEALTALRSR